jgi:hypothetical protein
MKLSRKLFNNLRDLTLYRADGRDEKMAQRSPSLNVTAGSVFEEVVHGLF